MEKKTEEFFRRPLYLYDLPPEILNTLALKTGADVEPQKTYYERATDPPKNDSGFEYAVGRSQSCSLCGLSFATVVDQRGHVKSDWHHYNLKQELRGLKPVSEAEFDELVDHLDESLSGSDSSDSKDDEDETSRRETVMSVLLKKQAILADRKRTDATTDDDDKGWAKAKRGLSKHPIMWFSCSYLPKEYYFGIYRSVFTSEEQKEESILEAIKKRQLAPISMPKAGKDGTVNPVAYKGPHFFLCMIGGGHFAAMVVSLAPRQTEHGAASGPLNREATVLAHKTFHKYTTRRKQGGSQAANDNAKGAAHSAGSALRRYNEQALVDDVRSLLREWKPLLDTSDLLFVRATGAANRRTLFGPYEGQILRGNDPRLRGFPFSTHRATQNELMRAFIELTRLKMREIGPEALADADDTMKLSTATTTTKQTKPAKPKLTEDEETALLHTSQLQALIRRSKLPALLSYLQSNDLSADFCFCPPETQQNYHAPTPLHLAASTHSAPLVTGLLTRGKANPGIKNLEGRTPFELASDRATRDAFRVARSELGEAAWDWEAAGVPPAMRREEAEMRVKEAEKKESERRRAEEERLRAESAKNEATRYGDDGRKKGVRSGPLGSGALKTPQEKREEEAKGLTPEQRMRLDRERRARAAEERLKRMQAGG